MTSPSLPNVAFLTHVGCFRHENQDAFLQIPEEGFFAVADGMGGHDDGALASRTAIKAFAEQAHFFSDDVGEAILKAHHAIRERRSNPLSTQSMATTGVVLKITDDWRQAIVAWCGDSRLYHFSRRANMMRQITQDHSLVQDLVRRQLLTPEQARHDKRRNIITHAIGLGRQDELHIEQLDFPLASGDVLVLCTDGLTNEVDDATIIGCLQQTNVPRNIAECLLSKALDEGGHDNITIGVICVP